MIHLGIDVSKKESYVVALDGEGKTVWNGAVLNKAHAVEALKAVLPAGEPVQSVLEAGWNWGVMYDLLEAAGFEPHLANTHKVGLIAESYVKTDKIDAKILAQLLRAGMCPEVHVPSRTTRDQRNLLRRRLWLVRVRTGLKNRMHSLLDRNHLEAPQITDLFGAQGLKWMRGLALREPEDMLLKADLDLLAFIQQHIRETEKWVDAALKDHPLLPRALSLPGVGKILGAMIALEVDTIGRFLSAGKLCAYSGLVSSTHGTGGKFRHGGLIPRANKHLSFAYVEAAWTAIKVSPYFGTFYRRLKARVGTQKAITATARKLCEVSYHCMARDRDYVEKPYQFRSGTLGRVLA